VQGQLGDGVSSQEAWGSSYGKICNGPPSTVAMARVEKPWELFFFFWVGMGTLA
jgi:hypothetical protein